MAKNMAQFEQGISLTQFSAAFGSEDQCERSLFAWVNTMLGNVKRSLHGTYHAISAKQLPPYLAEFCHQFNRRYNLAEMLPPAPRSSGRRPCPAASSSWLSRS
jgi:hypothetical protein